MKRIYKNKCSGRKWMRRPRSGWITGLTDERNGFD